MPAPVIRSAQSAKIERVPPMLWSTGCDSYIQAIQTCAAAVEIHVTYPILKGLSALAFRLMFSAAWRRYTPDALQGYDHTRLACGALGLSAETIYTRSADDAGRAHLRAALVESVNAGIPVPALQLMGWEDWGVVAGYRDAGDTLLCRTLHVDGEDLHPNQTWPWFIQRLTVTGPAPSRKGAVLRSLRVAVTLFESPSFGDYLSGQTAYRAWTAGLRAESFYQPVESSPGRAAQLLAAQSENLRADRPLDEPYLERAHVNHWRLKSLADARQSAAEYLEYAALLFGGEPGARMLAAGRDYAEVAHLIEQARAFAPAEHQLESDPWSQDRRDRQAALLDQALELESEAIQALRAALSRVSLRQV